MLDRLRQQRLAALHQQVAGTLVKIEGHQIARRYDRSRRIRCERITAVARREQRHEIVQHLGADVLMNSQRAGCRDVDPLREQRIAARRADDFEQQRS